MIEIKSRNLIEAPKKILIKNNVITGINVKANLLSESLGKVTSNKKIYNINLPEYQKGKKQSSNFEVDGLGFYLGGLGSDGYYTSDMSSFENNTFNGKIINYTYENGDVCDVFKLAVIEENFYNENGIKEIFDNEFPKMISSTEVNVLYVDSLVYKTSNSKIATAEYVTEANYNSPVFNDSGYLLRGTILIETYDKENFILQYLENGELKTVDLKNVEEYRNSFLRKGYQNIYIVTNVNEGSCTLTHIFPCLYFGDKNTNKVGVGSGIFDKTRYDYGQYGFTVVSSLTDAMETNLIKIESKEIPYGTYSDNFSLKTNELFQVKDINEVSQYQPVIDRILSKYVNGKETITFKCALANYYDSEGNLKYDKSKGEYISNGEVIRLYITKRKQEILFSNKNFLVTSSRLTFSNGYSIIEVEAEETERTEKNGR